MPCKEDDEKRTKWMKGCLSQVCKPSKLGESLLQYVEFKSLQIECLSIWNYYDPFESFCPDRIVVSA